MKEQQVFRDSPPPRDPLDCGLPHGFVGRETFRGPLQGFEATPSRVIHDEAGT